MMASGDYDAKIHKLFEEGKKLGAPGVHEINIANATEKQQQKLDQAVENITKPPINILELEREFDLQNREANRLQDKLNATRDRILKTGQAIADGSQNSVSSSTAFPVPQANADSSLYRNANANNNNGKHLNSNNSHHIYPNNGNSVLADTKIHLENALEDSQTQVRYLSNKLEDVQRAMADQKEQFRRAIEELQGKLQETVAGRKKLLNLRQQDMDQQEDMIHRLQTTLKELAASNQMQEQALLDAHERMEILENRNQSNELAMTQIRSIIGSTVHKDAARSKSSRFTDSERISELVPELLVDNLEKFVTSSYEEADSLRSKLLQLEAELNAANQAHEADQLLASSDASDAINALKLKYEESLAEEREKCKTAEEHLDLLTNEMREIQFDNKTQKSLVVDSRDLINDLNKQIDELRHDHHKEKGDFQSKLVCMEYDLKLATDLSQRLENENESLKQNITDSNNRMQQIVIELNTEREQCKSMMRKENDLEREINEMRLQAEEKTAEISRLREVAAQLRGDLSTKVAKGINEAENIQRIKADERVAKITEENIGYRENLSRATASLEAAERQLTDVISERSEAMQMIKEKDKQIDRLASQLSLSDRKLIEAKEARKTLEEKLNAVQADYTELSRTTQQAQSDLATARSVADDKERIAMQLRHQVETKTEHLKTSEKKADDAAKENIALASEVKEKIEAIGRLERLLDVKGESLADYESRMNALVEEKSRIVVDVKVIETQVANLMEAKEKLTDELNETRSQLTRLIDERDSLTKEAKLWKNKYKEETRELEKDLRNKKKDLQQIQGALHAVKNVDGKAAMIAANMQKEVTDKRGVIDTLQTELSKVYDKLEVEEKENKQHRKECSKLQKQVDDMKEKLKKSENELKNKTKTEKSYRLGVERLQTALEKAAVRNTEAQLMIDRQEDELSKAHIRRNLDMMDKRIPASHVGMVEERSAMEGAANVFGRPPVRSSNHGILQNMLARILATMATQVPSRDVTQISAKDNQVINRRVSSELQANLSTNDIYKVLTEVRDHLAAQDNQATSDKKRERQRKHNNRKSHKPKAVSANESSELPVVFAHSDVSSALSEASHTSTVDDADAVRSSHSQDFLFTSSPFKSNAVDFTGAGSRPPSPVSLLLAGGDTSLSQRNQKGAKKEPLSRIHLENLSEKFEADCSVSKKPEGVREKFVKDAISDNAEELCRQLQNRIEGLSKMGGKLERQNKVAAKLIKKQDEKLQQVRESGKRLR